MGASRPAVVFDCDGVLLESEPVWTRIETDLFARYGRTYGIAEKTALIGTGLGHSGKLFEEMLDQHGRAAELLAELIEMAAVEFARGVRAMPGAVELVAELERAGRPIAVASNSYLRLVKLALNASDLAGTLDVMVTADDVDAPKPAPDLYAEACRRLGTRPSETVAIEDSPTGVESARAAGLTVIGVPSHPEIRLDQADVVAASLLEPEVREALALPVTSGS